MLDMAVAAVVHMAAVVEGIVAVAAMVDMAAVVDMATVDGREYGSEYCDNNSSTQSHL